MHAKVYARKFYTLQIIGWRESAQNSLEIICALDTKSKEPARHIPGVTVDVSDVFEALEAADVADTLDWVAFRIPEDDGAQDDDGRAERSADDEEDVRVGCYEMETQ